MDIITALTTSPASTHSGKEQEALRWLRVTVKEGFPVTCFCARLVPDPIRKDSLSQFLAEMKTRWEGYQRELG